MSVLSSLTNRIFVASSVLVVSAIAVAVYLVSVSVTTQAEHDLHTGLDEAASFVGKVNGVQFDSFVQIGRSIADLPKLKNAVQTGDPPTVQQIAEEYERQIGADLFLVTDSSGRLLARAGRVTPDTAALNAMLRAVPAGGEAASFWPSAGGILQIAAFPLVLEPGPVVLGTLVVGLSLDQAAVAQMKQLTDSDVVIVDGTRIVASTLDAAKTGAFAPVAAKPIGLERIELGGEEYIGRREPLGPAAPGHDTPVAFVLRSRTERLRFLQRLQQQIAITGIAAVLIATLLSYGVARTVTRPLRAVTETMHDMAATGDLTGAPPRLGRWDDEDARLLATTFRQLTAALRRFQREAAQRERLSSLGRLSTVMAHEIRNPLMIIKAAVRNLRGHQSPDVVAAAANIDEEVARLNRVVTDVLDFARPLTFDLAPADLVEICRAAAQAVQAGPDGVPVALETDGGPAPLVTDAERLRAVLVNVLTNAQQAVRAAGRAGAPTPEVRLRASRHDGRWRVDVIDTGTGIAAEDLPRLFEPFFTTRRTGSGLGLALARNIVEGLGGAISVESRAGAGTTVHIDLPDGTSAALETQG
jgi:signal transduction histidine kinase